MNDILVRTDNVCKTFNSGNYKIHALRNVSLEVPAQSFVLLKGRSGSGKTTLMNVIGTLDRVDSGKIFYKTFEISSLDDRERTILRRKEFGFAFQSVALVSYMTAFENIELILKVAGYDPRCIKGRVEECMEFVGLSNRMHHKAYELSGGEQQRVGIARAIAHKPSLIFADEPTAELDSHMGLKIIKLFKDLVLKENTTLLMTSHDQAIREVADHVYTLEDGCIIEKA